MPEKLKTPIIIDFPLRGEWVAPNSPGIKIPSHGVDQLGQRYAYDFIKSNEANPKRRFCGSGDSLLHMLRGAPLNAWYGYGENVYAPCDGEIIKAVDGLKERGRVCLISDLFVILVNALFFNPKKQDIQRVTGNHIIMKIEQGYALFAHFQIGSVRVEKGQCVQRGDVLGRVGHSGNSTAPHLHFHLMDNPDPYAAAGLACAFTNCELFTEGGWKYSDCAIPNDKFGIRA